MGKTSLVTVMVYSATARIEDCTYACSTCCRKGGWWLFYMYDFASGNFYTLTADLSDWTHVLEKNTKQTSRLEAEGAVCNGRAEGRGKEGQQGVGASR